MKQVTRTGMGVALLLVSPKEKFVATRNVKVSHILDPLTGESPRKVKRRQAPLQAYIEETLSL